ncbi:hypothetical protein JOD43_002231 [Pullulanibacillus pueri]|uniref:Uncharacterized protein n=1 Tax=Pullulanibacillus pueri TaxID=1437324 RepID=A0A8J3ELP0_9BACL|nr:hypothetical protein [Pullulanibacillus pueri]MBM7682058.1 hypothetical protein [Pullulanibacillus pueri]GGH80141.1 hypothetical protein GCM10007096_16110 [Pullulanibacillus pueri]
MFDQSFVKDLTKFFYNREGRVTESNTYYYEIEKFLAGKISRDDFLELEVMINNLSSEGQFQSFKKGFQDGMKMMAFMECQL